MIHRFTKGRVVPVALPVLLFASVLTAAAPAFAHNAPKRCHRPQGKYANAGNLKAHGPVGCKKARRIARRWGEKCYYTTRDAGCFPGPTRIRVRPGYKCRQEYVPCCDGQGTKSLVRCTARGGRIVHFRWSS